MTDPPYGLDDWNNRGSNAKRAFDSEETQSWDNAPDAELMRLVLDAGKHKIIWGANYLWPHLYRTKQMFVWNKIIRGMHFTDCEIAWCSGWKDASRMFDLMMGSSDGPKQHPTQKPLALMRWCLQQLPASAKTIIDPFAGAGSTEVAAAELGLGFVGVEMQEKYFDISCKRIEDTLRRPDLFGGTLPPQHKQVALFDMKGTRNVQDNHGGSADGGAEGRQGAPRRAGGDRKDIAAPDAQSENNAVR